MKDTCTSVIYTLSLHDALPIWDEKWFLENEKTVTQFCRKLAAERPLKRAFSSQLAAKLRNRLDRKSGSAGMPRPSSYAVFCLTKKTLIYHVNESHKAAHINERW